VRKMISRFRKYPTTGLLGIAAIVISILAILNLPNTFFLGLQQVGLGATFLSRHFDETNDRKLEGIAEKKMGSFLWTGIFCGSIGLFVMVSSIINH
jgi:hypothetical protein